MFLTVEALGTLLQKGGVGIFIVAFRISKRRGEVVFSVSLFVIYPEEEELSLFF